MKYITILIVCFLLCGCIPFIDVAPVKRTYQLPVIENVKQDTLKTGSIQEKTLGETMLYKVDAFITKTNGFIATRNYQPPSHTFLGVTANYSLIKTDSQWVTYGTLDNGDTLYHSSTCGLPMGGQETAKWEYCIISNSQGEVYGDAACSFVHIREWPDKLPGFLIPHEIITYHEKSFRQEFIYNGRSKDMIKIQYREFNNDLARPSFYQDLVYDLSESRIIGFRGMTIEVIEATNSLIKFIVKTPMN